MDEWITAEEAARILAISTRQAYRYAKGDPPKVRTMEAGRRLLFSRVDVQALADELNSAYRPRPPQREVDAGELVALIRELQVQLMAAHQKIGELQGQISQRLLPDDERALRHQLEEAQAELNRLQSRSLWDRLRNK